MRLILVAALVASPLLAACAPTSDRASCRVADYRHLVGMTLLDLREMEIEANGPFIVQAGVEALNIEPVDGTLRVHADAEGTITQVACHPG